MFYFFLRHRKFDSFTFLYSFLFIYAYLNPARAVNINEKSLIFVKHFFFFFLQRINTIFQAFEFTREVDTEKRMNFFYSELPLVLFFLFFFVWCILCFTPFSMCCCSLCRRWRCCKPEEWEKKRHSMAKGFHTVTYIYRLTQIRIEKYISTRTIYNRWFVLFSVRLAFFYFILFFISYYFLFFFFLLRLLPLLLSQHVRQYFRCFGGWSLYGKIP